MQGHGKARRIKTVDVTIGKHHFQVQPEVAKGLVLVLSKSRDADLDDEGSIPASKVILELLDERSRPGIVLRGLRERDDLTQEEVAKKIGRPQSWISQMESGSRPIGPKMAKLLARVFDIGPGVFSSGIDSVDDEG